MSLSSDQDQPGSQEPHSSMMGSQKSASAATDHIAQSDRPPSSSAPPALDRESLADKKSDDNPPSLRATPEPQEPKSDFIITLKQDTTKEQFEAYKQQLLDQGSEIRHEYFSIILKGFAVALRPSMLQSFQQDPLVKDIEMDQKVHI